MIEGARHAGMDADSLVALREEIEGGLPKDDAEFTRIWPDNVPAVEAFLAVATQWRVVACSPGGALGPGGGAIGPSVPIYLALDYAAVRAGLDAEGIAVTPELWRGLRVMEQAAAAALNEVS
ncbi:MULTISPECIES: DUF1799 domain-containing protein [unclassified Bradyrhizobium]|uniref:DUF1799 domain-containing protein n=1 Tax=unclassified Bradyrhizobium TaxID=2631580 RepID=UPI00211E7DF3|nr:MULTISPECIES: DUF1799 domain-containing protein [unclassified Bradyrhizobium]